MLTRSLRPSDRSSEMPGKKFGIRLWYFIKIVEYVLVAICVLLLVLNEYLSDVHDDFTPAYTRGNETRKDPRLTVIQNLSANDPALAKPHLDDRLLLRVKRDGDGHHHPKTKLSYLLVLYPCCVTVVIFLTMELLAQVLKDPLNKLSNIIVIVLCILLSITIFVESLICAIDTAHVSMILVAILSAVLIVIVIIDFILLILS